MSAFDYAERLSIFLPVLIVYFLASSANAADHNDSRQLYVVYMGEQPRPGYWTKTLHLDLLHEVIKSRSPRQSLVYSYTKSFHGFAARLTEHERDELACLDGIVSVFPSKIYQLRTTRSWDFLQFPSNVNRNLPLERDVIVGMIDSGIWPESKSFSDEGLGPPPKKWNGSCINFECNNKIIGARYYNSLNDTTQEESPRDYEGHGTHTASTVAGRSVSNAHLYGIAKGTARGAVSSARLAIYKACWSFGCADVDILAAFDDAIADGVDILSVSLGADSAFNYFEDPIAIGAFHAMKKGILTSVSGGNSGPYRGTVANVAPWMLVSAASSIDRHIIDRLVIGENKIITGASVNTFATEKQFYPFVYFGDGTVPDDCYFLNKSLVEGKIVLCGSPSDGTGPLLAGAKGAVMMDNLDLDTSFSFPLPALLVSYSDGRKLMQYINKTKNPVANIRKSEAVFDRYAPVVASFSSRGPNVITPNILKPDISSPGVDILAAWSPEGSMSGSPNDTRIVKFNIISGTSMACPHTTGAAAYVKSFHPDWSPAAIMSALMTTATPMNDDLHTDLELAYGAGQINPVKAIHPGLVYDTSEKDYVEMLCNQGYNNLSLIRLITGETSISCNNSAEGTVNDLNYPSMALYVDLYKPFKGRFRRTVTNVGESNRIYTVTVSSSPRINVTVHPTTLSFKRSKNKRSFSVTVSGGPFNINTVVSASITWSDGNHSVRSVISVYTDYTS